MGHLVYWWDTNWIPLPQLPQRQDGADRQGADAAKGGGEAGLERPGSSEDQASAIDGGAMSSPQGSQTPRRRKP